MPSPNPGESRDDFVTRCIPIVIEDGTAEGGAQGRAICESIFDQAEDGAKRGLRLISWTPREAMFLPIKQVETVAPPVNEAGLTAEATLERTVEAGRKFSKEEANYIQPAPQDERQRNCGRCWFYLGPDEQGVQQCQVVNGGIEWFGHSDLFIDAKIQEAVQRQNAGELEDDMSKATDRGMEHKTLPFIVTKIDEEKGIVTHTVAVMGNVDLGGDVIHPGAFTKTINERMNQIRVLDSHNTGSVMDVVGKPIAMREVSGAELPLQVKAAFPDASGALMAETQFLIDTPEGKGVFERIKANAVDQYSIGYEALDVDFEEREIDGQKQYVRNLRTIKLFEYSPVVFAMNPATSTVGVKEADETTDPPAAGTEGALESDIIKTPPHYYGTKLNLSELVRSVTTAFYSQYPDSLDEVFWVKQVHDEFVIVDQRGRTNTTWKIAYTNEDGMINFASKGDWLQVEAVFIPVIKEQKIGRAISAARMGRIRGIIEAVQEQLGDLGQMLDEVAPAEEGSQHDDEEKIDPQGDIKKESDTHQEPPDETGPDKEPPISDDALLAELEKHLAEIESSMEVK